MPKEVAADWQVVTKPIWSVYCDGSSTGRSDREGGYGWIILKNDEPVFSGYGGHPRTTNNIMEITGAICGLEALLACGQYNGESIELVSDSQYTLGIANGTYYPQKNLDVCNRLKELVAKTKAVTRWVKGHTGKSQWNDRCDSLAKRGKMEQVTSRSS